MLKDSNISFLFFFKILAEFRLHLGHPKLSTTISLLKRPIITRSLNSGPHIKPHNSTPHTIHTIYIYIYPTSKFNMNIVHHNYIIKFKGKGILTCKESIYNIRSVLRYFKRVNYKITKILHVKLNLYKYIKACTKVYYINTLIPFCFKLNIYINFAR
jgi:hypothetical protein